MNEQDKIYCPMCGELTPGKLYCATCSRLKSYMTVKLDDLAMSVELRETLPNGSSSGNVSEPILNNSLDERRGEK